MSTSVSISSAPAPLPGQSHRSSVNFSLGDLTNWGELLWECPDGVAFDVKVDRTGHDPTLCKQIGNGSVTPFYSDRSVYIANPHGSHTEFTVTAKSKQPKKS